MSYKPMTVRLPQDLADGLAIVSRVDGISQADVIRAALVAHVVTRRSDPAFQAAAAALAERLPDVRRCVVSRACGSCAAYQAHRRRGEGACAACREACRVYTAERRASQPPKPPRVLVPCGSVTAYRRHLRRGEQPCAPCRAAQTAALAEYRSRTSERGEVHAQG